ncbi:MAG: YncE family protein [Bacteroidia bacterium]
MLFTIYVFAFLFSSCKKENNNTHDPPAHISPKIEGKIYVANEHNGLVSVIDASTNKVIKTIYLDTEEKNGFMPHNIQVSPDGKAVWVTVVGHSHDIDEEIVVLDASKDSIIKRIATGAHIHLAHVVFSSDGNFAYVTATEGNFVMEIDAKTYKITRTFPFSEPHEPHGLRYFSGKLYIANLKHNCLAIINLAGGKTEHVELGGMAVQTAISPNGKYVFVSVYNTMEIIRINIASREIFRIKLPVGSQGPIQIYPTPDSKQLYICDQGILLTRPASDKVFVMDIESGEIKHTITSAMAPHGVVVSKGGEYAYVTNMMSDNVSVIETSIQKVIAKIPVGSGPNGISFKFKDGGMP